MKYVILANSDNVEPFIEPRQLSVVNGETLVGRAIRLLKENGVKEVIITSHDPRFDNLGTIRYEPQFNDYRGKEQTGYWLDAFPREMLIEPVTFLLGDVYYSEDAIKTIVKKTTKSVMFFCSDKTKGYDERYIKHHDEPFAFKVVNYKLFLEHIDKVKQLYDEGKTRRHPIAWELYRSINGIDVNTHKLTKNYVAINDETCDIDCVEDVEKLEYSLNPVVIEAEAIRGFTYGEFKNLHNLVRVNQDDREGHLSEGDRFECDYKTARYLLGDNPKGFKLIKIIKKWNKTL